MDYNLYGYIRRRVEHYSSERGMSCIVESCAPLDKSVRIYLTKGVRTQQYAINPDGVIDFLEADTALGAIFDDCDKKFGINYIPTNYDLPKIKDVIYNGPATIVFWVDGSKTVVKCQEDDDYDPEKGLAMAIAKKALGNKGNYCNIFKKWLPDEEDVDTPVSDDTWENFRRALNAVYGVPSNRDK